MQKKLLRLGGAVCRLAFRIGIRFTRNNFDPWGFASINALLGNR
jgi:hypothetical protein